MAESKETQFRVSSFLLGDRNDETIQEDALQTGQLVRRTVSRGADVGELKSELIEMRQMLSKVVERGNIEQKVFDSLHSELKEYKNDFFYERLKPIVRPLLFLHDSLSQLDDEVKTRVSTDAEMQKTVQENLAYFRTQLEEVLAICEVTPITETDGVFDGAIHKAVETVPVAPELENTVQGVVRGGWYLNGTLLRPVEVVRGRAK